MNLKRALLLGLLLAVLIITAKSADAQFNDPSVNALVQSNLNMVHSLRSQYYGARIQSSLENLIFNPAYGAYGYYSGGSFIPVQRGPIGRREGTIYGAGIGAAIGGGVGSLIGKGHPGAGMAIGAGGGAIVGMLLGGRNNGNNDRPVNCSKRKLNRKEQEFCSTQVEQARIAAVEQAAVAEQQRWSLAKGRFYNSSRRLRMQVFDGGQLVAELRPGQSMAVPDSDGYEVYFLAPNPSMPGNFVQIPAESSLAKDGSGWIFFPQGEVTQ